MLGAAQRGRSGGRARHCVRDARRVDASRQPRACIPGDRRGARACGPGVESGPPTPRCSRADSPTTVVGCTCARPWARRSRSPSTSAGSRSPPTCSRCRATWSIPWSCSRATARPRSTTPEQARSHPSSSSATSSPPLSSSATPSRSQYIADRLEMKAASIVVYEGHRSTFGYEVTFPRGPLKTDSLRPELVSASAASSLDQFAELNHFSTRDRPGQSLLRSHDRGRDPRSGPRRHDRLSGHLRLGRHRHPRRPRELHLTPANPAIQITRDTSVRSDAEKPVMQHNPTSDTVMISYAFAVSHCHIPATPRLWGRRVEAGLS